MSGFIATVITKAPAATPQSGLCVECGEFIPAGVPRVGGSAESFGFRLVAWEWCVGCDAKIRARHVQRIREVEERQHRWDEEECADEHATVGSS